MECGALYADYRTDPHQIFPVTYQKLAQTQNADITAAKQWNNNCFRDTNELSVSQTYHAFEPEQNSIPLNACDSITTTKLQMTLNKN